MSQYEVYKELKRARKGLTTKELCERLGYNEKTISTLCKKLRKHGFLKAKNIKIYNDKIGITYHYFVHSILK